MSGRRSGPCRLVALVLLALLAAGPAPAVAERLILSLSSHRVLISSNFTGDDLTLFGAIEQDAASVGRGGGYALAVVVVGPPQSTVTWRKERRLGLWVNAASRTFVDAPSYLAMLANRPFADIAGADALQANRLGLMPFIATQEMRGSRGIPARDQLFRDAFVRLKTGQLLYLERDNAITFIAPSLFRATIPLPAHVPTGTYEVTAFLYADGVLLGRETTAFEIVKTGFEQWIAQAARDHSLFYGLATMALALFTGWIGSIVFRRD